MSLLSSLGPGGPWGLLGGLCGVLGGSWEAPGRLLGSSWRASWLAFWLLGGSWLALVYLQTSSF